MIDLSSHSSYLFSSSQHISSTRSPPPPTATLFPYTTLFRSHDPGAPGRGHRDRQAPRCVCAGTEALGRADRLRPRASVPAQDRKSTRLNSSHVAISYAVFCLKKKKK